MSSFQYNKKTLNNMMLGTDFSDLKNYCPVMFLACIRLNHLS